MVDDSVFTDPAMWERMSFQNSNIIMCIVQSSSGSIQADLTQKKILSIHWNSFHLHLVEVERLPLTGMCMWIFRCGNKCQWSVIFTYSLVYVLAAILVSYIVRDLKLGIAGDNPQNLCDPDFTTFVSQPSKEELWAVVSPVKWIKLLSGWSSWSWSGWHMINCDVTKWMV